MSLERNVISRRLGVHVIKQVSCKSVAVTASGLVCGLQLRFPVV